MADNEAPTETTPFWRFSLHFYRQPGVSDACIALQDDCGVDVNLLLFLLWLAADGQLLSADDVKKLDDKVRDWRNLTIIPIRDMRRKLKDARDAGRCGKAGSVSHQGEGDRARGRALAAGGALCVHAIRPARHACRAVRRGARQRVRL